MSRINTCYTAYISIWIVTKVKNHYKAANVIIDFRNIDFGENAHTIQLSLIISLLALAENRILRNGQYLTY